MALRYLPTAAALFCSSLVLADSAPVDSTTELPPVTVTASELETATSPVEGYVATRASGASKTDTPILETPQSISIIGSEQIRDQGAQTVQDALRYSAGVRGEPYGLDSRGDWGLIRGTSPVLFQDGLQQSFGYYASSRPDPFTLERIEVIRGPSSVLYGQGSVGGIVNLMSKRPQVETRGEFQLQYGSYDRKQIAVDMTGSATDDDRFLYRLIAVGRGSDTQVDHVPDDRRVLAPSFTWRPSEQTEWTVLMMAQEDDTGSSTAFLPHEGTVLPALYGEIDSSRFVSEPGFDAYDTKQQSVTSLLSHRFNDTWIARQNLRWSQSEVDYRTMYAQWPPGLNADNRTMNRVYWIANPELESLTADQQLEAHWQGDRVESRILLGVDYQHAVTNRDWSYGLTTPIDLYAPVYTGFIPVTPVTFYSDPEQTVEQTGVYAQGQFTFDGHWLLTAGLRQDWATTDVDGSPAQDDDALTGRIAISYLADNGVAPYLSYSQSFEPTIGLDAYGKAYDPLEGEQVELGVKYQPTGSTHLLTAAIYDLREKNRKTPDPVNPVNQLQTGEARARGVELEALMQFDRWDVIASYTWTDTKVMEGTPGYDDGKRLPSVAEHQASLWGVYRFSIAGMNGFSAGAGVRYVGDSWDGTDALKTPSYTLFDAMLGYEQDQWSVTVNATNLEDETYYTTCLARGDCFIGTRRTIMGTVSYRY
ncbi:MAG: TonB-dependent siderophore receptor [Gammaproteobacteria bacterium]|nr:MAG: TonB-dependent siderophore receptor [Gammaproteobacteria bacterium]